MICITKKKIYTIGLSLYGDRETCEPKFLYELNKNNNSFIHENEYAIKKLFKDMKLKNVEINFLIEYLLILFKFNYRGEIFEYCFSNLSDSDSDSDSDSENDSNK